MNRPQNNLCECGRAGVHLRNKRLICARCYRCELGGSWGGPAHECTGGSHRHRRKPGPPPGSAGNPGRRDRPRPRPVVTEYDPAAHNRQLATLLAQPATPT